MTPHDLLGRAEQIREVTQDPKRLTCNSAELLNALNWNPIATALEAAAEELR